jgi:hypothetical protein
MIYAVGICRFRSGKTKSIVLMVFYHSSVLAAFQAAVTIYFHVRGTLVFNIHVVLRVGIASIQIVHVQRTIREYPQATGRRKGVTKVLKCCDTSNNLHVFRCQLQWLVQDHQRAIIKPHDNEMK